METIIGVIIGSLIGASVTLLVQHFEHKDRFRMAAIDKRLEAHQKAFEQCMYFIEGLSEHDAEKVRKVFKDGQAFYCSYSLYLEKQTRKKFIEALGVINAYCPRWDYLKELKEEDRQGELKKIHLEYEKVYDLAYIIQKEVELEPIIKELNFKSLEELH